MSHRLAALCSILAACLLATPLSATIMVAEDRRTWGDAPLYSPSGEYRLTFEGYIPNSGPCVATPGYVWLKWSRTADDGGVHPDYGIAWRTYNDGSIWTQYDIGLGYHMNQQGCRGQRLVMQGDGNLVLYSDSSETTPVWHTSSWGNSGGYLSLQDDGNLVVYSPNDTPLWSVW